MCRGSLLSFRFGGARFLFLRDFLDVVRRSRGGEDAVRRSRGVIVLLGVVVSSGKPDHCGFCGYRAAAPPPVSQPLSDLAAVGLGDRIMVAGGRGRSGTVAAVSAIRKCRGDRRDVGAGTSGAGASQRDERLRSRRRERNSAAPPASAISRLYVPNSKSNSVDVIDPTTFRVVAHFPVGGLPQHVVPAYDLKTLYVTNDMGNSLTPIDPRTGRPGHRSR